MSTLTLPTAAEVSSVDIPLLFPGAVGFYFVFRDCLTFLFFQADPVTGTIVNIGIDLVFLFGAILYSTGTQTDRNRLLLQIAPIRWILAFLTLSLASIMWTGAQSGLAAAGYWAGMAADVSIVLLLLRNGNVIHRAEGIMKGAVLGAVALAIVAWSSPTTGDLRLGNDDFLHPNGLGLEIGIAILIAQYLAPRGVLWKWLGIGLAITLLRTLSKTAIIAFVVAECWYLFKSDQMSRKAKVLLTGAALLVVASFWGLLISYLDLYNNTGSGNQAETLTGRTLIWTTAFTMGLEKPWFGHGLYSFRALIPAFGIFEPWHAHNELLQQFFEFGTAGVVVVVGVYWSFFRLARRAVASELRILALTLLLFAIIRGIADTVNFGLSYPLWLQTGLSICLVQPVTFETSSHG